MRIVILAGEVSGDTLGAALMNAVNARGQAEWHGIGGEAMAAEGFSPFFAMDEIAVNGFDAIVRQLPSLLKRIKEAADNTVALAPDALLIVDAPEFTHRVAQRVRRARPTIPIINYVSPTVWAWRPGRARAMRAYVDHVLALFPFEPEVHRRLQGPPATYVGHPLFQSTARDEAPDGDRLLILPGSRRGEIERLMAPFGAALRFLPNVPVSLLAVERLRERIEALTASWPRPPEILSGKGAKARAFREARAALAASGTVTFELSAARIPMVVGYRLDGIGKLIKAINPVIPIVKAPSMVLTNIALGRNEIPAFLDNEGTPEALAGALLPLLEGGPERQRQAAAFQELHAMMRVPRPPAEMAADAFFGAIEDKRVSG